MSRICVAGSWHLATVMAACFAEAGQTVVGVDDNEEAIASLKQGRPTLYEPEMEPMVKSHVETGRLSYTTNFEEALSDCAIVFLAIDTPIREDGIDLTPIRKAVENIAAAAKKDYILVVSSQVPVGTCEELQDLARRTNSGAGCDVVCNPEFLRLGNAIALFQESDRIILGADDPDAAKRVAEVYEPLDRPIVFMSLREAEIVKHATNAYVANSVSFIGEISQLCDEMGADAYQVGEALRLDRRIGRYAYVRPGLGFNGGTVARDVKLLIDLTKKANKSAPLLESVLEVNQRQNRVFLERLKQIFGDLNGVEAGILGLTYKAHTSTLRHSLTLKIAKQMQQEGMKLKAYDPIIPVDEYDPAWKISPCKNMQEAAQGSDALIIMTDKDEFKDLNLAEIGPNMSRRILVDAVNLFEPQHALDAGFTYIALGRGFEWLSPNHS